MVQGRRRLNIRPRRFRTRNGNRSQTSRSVPNRGGPSKVDQIIHRRTIDVFRTAHVVDSVSGVAYGLANFTAIPGDSTTNPYLNTIFTGYKDQYEQYRFRRARVYVNPGKYFTNDIRIKTQIAGRADIDNLPNTSAPSTLGVLLSSTNVKVKSLKADVPLLICDYAPRCAKVDTTSQASIDQRILTPAQRWMGMSNLQDHKWKGSTVALMLPDEAYTPSAPPTISIRIRYDLEFRGRNSNRAVFSQIDDTLNQPTPPLDGATFDVVDLARTYTVVSNTPTEVVVSYSPTTSDETLVRSTFFSMINTDSWFGNPITNWNGPSE